MPDERDLTDAEKKRIESDSAATARVEITIEIDARSNWGGECTVAQVLDQAGREARGRLVRLFDQERGIRIVGKPRVTAVLARDRH